MPFSIQRVEYFYTTVKDQPGEAFTVLSALASHGINLLAFSAVPLGALRTQLTLFPEDPGTLTAVARQAGMTLDGPHRALLVLGDDELGALAKIHGRLSDAHINVYASSCVTDGRGSYGYLIYVKPEDYNRAADALRV
jgi:hypothetical protein